MAVVVAAVSGVEVATTWGSAGITIAGVLVATGCGLKVSWVVVAAAAGVVVDVFCGVAGGVT